MLTIGLTGGIGAGKTSVADLFAKHGIDIIDADILARELTRPDQAAFKEIIEHFDHQLLKSDGHIDRAALRGIIFAHPEERQWLEDLLHPLILQEIGRQVQTHSGPYCITVIPLLLESGPHPFIDRILLVDSPEDLQIKRATTRDKSSKDVIKTILETQMKREERQRLADDIILNDGDLHYLSQQVDKLHNYYLQLASK